MASPNFTEEEMRILMENPYTLNVTPLQENPASYSKLKTEVIYLREEVEFLKKISQKVISGKRGK